MIWPEYHKAMSARDFFRLICDLYWSSSDSERSISCTSVISVCRKHLRHLSFVGLLKDFLNVEDP